MARTSSRTQAKQFYTLTNQLQKQLQVLCKSKGAVNVQVKQSKASLPGVDGDIEALAFIVLMQASKSAQEDLKAIMAQVKAINSAKAELREQVKPSRSQTALDFEATFQLMATLYQKQLDAELEQTQQDLDSMSEMGEMESLRLQMMMDRLSKMMSTLSNILKKIADTNSQIVQNLK
jgi:hypothetical protein